MARKYHFLYLRKQILTAEYAHLHRFLHPGTMNQEGWCHIVCADLDLNHFVFLECIAKNYEGGHQRIQIRYDLVASILEIESRNNQFGFLDQENAPAQQADSRQ